MKNMQIKQKLIISFAIVACFAIIIGVVGVVGLSRINSNEDLLYKYSLNTNAANRLITSIHEQRVAYRDAVLYMNDEAKREDAITKLYLRAKDSTTQSDFLTANLVTGTAKGLLENAKTAYGKFTPLREQLVELTRAGDDAAAHEMLTTMTPYITATTDALQELANYAIDLTDTTNTNDSATALFLIILMAGVAVLSAVIAISLGIYLSGIISKPVVFISTVLGAIGSQGTLDFPDADWDTCRNFAKQKDELGQSAGMLITMVTRLVEVGKTLETVANGDLTSDLAPLSSTDNMGLSLKKMQESLNKMFNEINQSTIQVSTGAKQVADGSQSLAQGSTEQAAAVEQLSSSISQIAEKTKENAGQANKAAHLSETVRINAERGSHQMNEMMQAVKEINDASTSISKVIKVIDDIAFQTNILALNAAVEAARAGQHGKGFAVVAEEVRNLAGKSAAAASDTGVLIANSMEKAELGAKIAAETAASLTEIVSGINESSSIVNGIAVSSEEQTSAIDQINSGIDQVAQVVQQNSATAEESAAASEEMSGQSELLQDLVAQFKLKNGAPANRAPLRTHNKPLSMPPKSTHSFDGDFGKY